MYETLPTVKLPEITPLPEQLRIDKRLPLIGAFHLYTNKPESNRPPPQMKSALILRTILISTVTTYVEKSHRFLFSVLNYIVFVYNTRGAFESPKYIVYDRNLIQLEPVVRATGLVFICGKGSLL